MDIFMLVAFSIVVTALVGILKVHRPDMVLPVTVGAGVMMLLYILGTLTGVVESIRSMASRYGIDTGYVGTLVKIIGIAYVAQFGAEICKDGGDGAMASKVEAGGRVLILASALPAAVALLELVAGILPSLQS